MRLKRIITSHRKLALAGAVLAGLCSAVLVFATTFELVQVSSSDIQKAAWPSSAFPLAWSINSTNTSVYSGGSSTAGTTLATPSNLAAVLKAGFGLWSGALYPSGTGTNVNTLAFSATPASSTQPTFNGADCVNTIGFTGTTLPTGVIAETVVSEVHTTSPGSPAGIYDCTAAPAKRTCPSEVCIVDADVEFNQNVKFYTSSYTTPPGSFFDLETTATHEIGHMIGLDHSGLTNAVMFPYGDNGKGGVKHALAIDDEIGSSVLYPNPAMQSLSGAISGTVKVGGDAAFAAHVVAIDSSTGNVITDTLTDSEGNYRLDMFQGTYRILVLPLGTPTTDPSAYNGATTILNYTGFSGVYPGATVQTHFNGSYY